MLVQIVLRSDCLRFIKFILIDLYFLIWKKYILEELIMKVLINKLKINKRYLCILSFIVPGVLAFLILFINDYLGKEGNYFLYSDALGLFIPYYRSVARAILNGESIYYLWDVYFGSNFSLNLASYCMSPFNILYVIFYNANPENLSIIIFVIKVMLSGFTFNIFCKRILNIYDYKSLLISCFYALSNYVMYYASVNMMWHDIVVFLPILGICLIEAINDNKYLRLGICYSVIFICNYYLGYMVGISSLLVFILYFLLVQTKFEVNFKCFLINFSKFCISAIMGVVVSSFVWLPALLFLLNNRVEDSTPINDIYITILEVLNGVNWRQYNSMLGHFPYIYFGIISVILFVAFWANNEIKFKIKLFFLGIIVYFLLCMLISPLNVFMHAFDQPDGFNYRYLFILIFVLCILAVMSFSKLNSAKPFWILVSVLLFNLIYISEIILQRINNSIYTPNTYWGLYINLSFYIIYAILLILLQKYTKASKIIVPILAVFVSAEVISNYSVQADTADKDIHNSIRVLYSNTISEINKDEDLYRVLINFDVNPNSDSDFGFNGVVDFSTGENYNLRKMHSKIGLGSSPRTLIGNGFTPISNMLLSVKYIANGLKIAEEVDDSYVCNPYYLGMGFMCDEKLMDFSFDSRDAFYNCNELLKAMTEIDNNVFNENIPVHIHPEGCELYYDEADSCYYLERTTDDGEVWLSMYADSEYPDTYIQFEMPAYSITEYDYAFEALENTVNASINCITCGMMVPLNNDSDAPIKAYGFTITRPFIAFSNINTGSFDIDSFLKHYNALKDNTLNITKHKNGYLEANINVSDKKLLYTSIPYDESWSVYVDGKKIKPVALIDDTFLGILFDSEGYHEIKMKYTVPGLFAGYLISALSVGLLLLYSLIFVKKFKLSFFV